MENFHNTFHDADNTLEKAPLIHRVVAFLVDYIVLGAVLAVPFVIFVLRDIDADPARIFAMFPIFMLVVFIVYALRHIVNGQSYGKYMLGIGVRDSDDTAEVPSIPRLFTRNIFIFIWPIEFLVLACGSSRTKLGDRLAGTNVYRVSSKPKLLMMIVPIILIVAIFVSSLVFGIMFTIRNHSAYQTALDYIETNPRIIELVGDIESFGFFPNGSISTSGGHGQADFTIRVNGSDRTAHVHVRLIREPLEDWEVISLRYRQ